MPPPLKYRKSPRSRLTSLRIIRPSEPLVFKLLHRVLRLPIDCWFQQPPQSLYDDYDDYDEVSLRSLQYW